MNDFTTTLVSSKPPAAVFAAIADVRSWWTGKIAGDSGRLGAEFTYRYKDMHTSTQRVTAFEPGARLVWDVTASELTFVRHRAAWDGTRIVFALSPHDGGTRVVFTHEGLVPSCECYADCAAGWTHYLEGSLKALLS